MQQFSQLALAFVPIDVKFREERVNQFARPPRAIEQLPDPGRGMVEAVAGSSHDIESENLAVRLGLVQHGAAADDPRRQLSGGPAAIVKGKNRIEVIDAGPPPLRP